MKIIDNKLEPFEIHHDGNNYSVVEKTDKLDKEGKFIYKNHAFCTSVSSALNKIIKLQIEGKQDVYDLRQYVKGIKYASERIESLIL